MVEFCNRWHMQLNGAVPDLTILIQISDLPNSTNKETIWRKQFSFIYLFYIFEKAISFHVRPNWAFILKASNAWDIFCSLQQKSKL